MARTKQASTPSAVSFSLLRLQDPGTPELEKPSDLCSEEWNIALQSSHMPATGPGRRGTRRGRGGGRCGRGRGSRGGGQTSGTLVSRSRSTKPYSGRGRGSAIHSKPAAAHASTTLTTPVKKRPSSAIIDDDNGLNSSLKCRRSRAYHNERSAALKEGCAEDVARERAKAAYKNVA